MKLGSMALVTRVEGSCSFINSHVRLIGRVNHVNQDIVTLDTSDGEQVEVQINRGTNFIYEGYIEVVGKVNPNLTIRELASYQWAPTQTDFDFQLYDEMLQAYHKHRELFA